MTGQVNLTVRQGATFVQEFRWIEPRFIFEALNAGTSDATEPIWPVDECDTILDNDILWANRGGFDPHDPANNRVDCWFPNRQYAEGNLVHNSDVPIDNTGYTARMEIRDNKDDAVGVVLATITETISASGIIILGGADGLFTLVLEAAITEAFTFKKAFYDVLLVSPVAANFPNGITTRVIQGDVLLSKDTTK